MDMSSIYSGNMLKDLVPSPQPPTQVFDPKDTKPSDWDEEEYINDKDASKPDDWDEGKFKVN